MEIFTLVHGVRPGYVTGIRLCTRCLKGGKSVPAEFCIVHPWWTFKWSECVCEECACDAVEQTAPPEK